jgi:hypothetical protein
MDARAALAFVREHGVVLVSARGPVPTLTHAIAGEAIRASWWGHPQGKRICAVLSEVSGAPEVLVCRLVDDKLTLVHRRFLPRAAATRTTRRRFPRGCRTRCRRSAHLLLQSDSRVAHGFNANLAPRSPRTWAPPPYLRG